MKHAGRTSVLIIGGGINGVGTFRDLSLQGIDVTLIERGDYCQGASGASSHMIHGGIRYLENGEFRLVRESVVERNALLKLAPHYVKPLQTTIPVFSTFSGILAAPLRFLTHRQGAPRERGAVLIKAGLTLYDAFSRAGGTVPRHKFIGRKASLAQLPKLRPDVKYTATYFDASVHNPERLTLDVLQDGLRANPRSRAVNYVSAVGSSDEGIVLRDELSGEVFPVQADVVVNASGAWVDGTNSALGQPSSFMGGTKGSHIVLDHPELLAACAGREIFFEHSDGRIVLIYPMGDRVLVGTTDIETDMDAAAVCTDAEIDYFFDLIHHVFPTVRATRDSIVYTFSGVRPLPRHDDTQPGFVSRDYRIERGTTANRPMLSLVGGKWTTFRALSEHLADEVLGLLQRSRTVSTAAMPIGGGMGFPQQPRDIAAWTEANGAGLPAERVRLLLERYGTRAAEVAAFIVDGEDRPLQTTREVSTRELEYMVLQEQVQHISDVIIRRTALAFNGLVSAELIDEIADILGTYLDWTAAERKGEIEDTRRLLQEQHKVSVHSLVA
ncbi:glycerol-3-phosphate dehydrogenase/oxidase [Arthrobacter sp. EH-1B-1]|uniref:Glycerol-3-phosphate dehydrogenase/oxidase n=1 Tax=Arthrobacter vasquezii TaxID=2977629 RepID=A0ABT6CYF9_9MICC|nr:glycerol-3-phosphate dehydrogenase/oxidase [Arthrobacter vasquezii]MDF9279122.1 glycerol-3-phosphate dehydrogenase/oxidase [Arthrobacter vasquezii]